MGSEENTGARGAADRVRFNEEMPAGPLSSPAAERNKGPIRDRLAGILPDAGLILEIASGTGQHVAFFAAAWPGLEWQPTEPDAELIEAMRSLLESASAPNVRDPIRLDVTERPWPIRRADAVLCSNMIHIAPWEATLALFDGAKTVLGPRAPLILYGPFKRGGRHTAPSNEQFDASLRARNADWGVRDLDDVAEVARRNGFTLEQSVDMPANNLLVVFRSG